jgi:deoxyribose-phosphate aldolase
MDSNDLERLIDAITREVLGHLAAHQLDACELQGCDGTGRCVVMCPAKTKQVIDAGADRISAGPGVGAGLTPDVAKLIDHTLLKPDASEEQIRALCAEAKQYGFATVCVNPYWVRLCADLLRGSGVGVTSVIGFPLGAGTTDAKVFEADRAIKDGASEIDMVMNIGALKSRDHRTVARDIAAVAVECHNHGALLKVILETGFLTDEEKVEACALCLAADADYVKTSTGFGPGGATPADVAIMRAAVGPAAGVKAAGGVRSLADAHQMVAAGATRIGASAGVKLVKDLRGESAPADPKAAPTGKY